MWSKINMHLSAGTTVRGAVIENESIPQIQLRIQQFK